MEPITQNFRFSAVLQAEIPVAEPYVVGSIREYLHLRRLKFGELPTKGEFASFGASPFQESIQYDFP